MKPTERAKQALAYKLVDYLCDDPENNMANIMGKIDALAPASLFAEQRAAFSDAIKNKTNMYQLIMRVMDLNPEVRADLLKTFVMDARNAARRPGHGRPRPSACGRTAPTSAHPTEHASSAAWPKPTRRSLRGSAAPCTGPSIRIRPVDEMALEPALADELRCALDEGALLSQADAAVVEQAVDGAAERAEKAADEVTA